MVRHLLVLALSAIGTAAESAPAQNRPTTDSTRRAAEAPDSGARAAATPQLALRRSPGLDELLTKLAEDPWAKGIPAADSFSVGARSIAAGTTVAGPIAVAAGNLDVYGTVTGDAYVVNGDVIVHAGGRVTGNALAARGHVRLDGGTVLGEVRELGGGVGAYPEASAAPRQATPATTTRHALSLSVGWLIVLVLIGIGVLVFASSYLDGVVDTLEASFGRSFVTGIAAQLGLLPALVIVIVALALTILGILLIPFAVVAFTLAVCGLVTLGFLAVARLTGQSIASRANRRLSARGAALRAIVVGSLVLMALWIVSALFMWAPIVGIVIRIAALAVTWVAATAGLGAAVLSGAGTRRPKQLAAAAAAPADPVSWQTPTPVTGVVAARRPAAASGSKGR
jgi:hypothetical protein